MPRSTITNRPLIRSFLGALVLSGSPQYVNLGNTGPIATATGSFTLSAWFKRLNNTGVIAVVGDRGSGSIQRFTINFNSPYRSVPTISTSGGGTALTVLEPYPSFQWQHGMLRFDGVNGTTFRMGQLETQQARTGTVTAPTGDMAIGSGNNSGRYWVGMISEVKFWERALSDEECAAVYQGRNDAGIREGMTGEWLLADDVDDTFGTNNGTAVGSPTFNSTDMPFANRVSSAGRVPESERIPVA